jgi:hypothetical protein
MANPKSLVFHLHKHWETLAALARASREHPSFQEEQLLGLLAQQHPGQSTDEHWGMLRSLCNTDIVQILPRSGGLQLNPLVLEFVRGLTREHELGLSTVLQARVEAVRSATNRLSEGLAARDMDRLLGAAARLAELFRQIGQQLDQDRHAILELAERAKAADSAMPLARRYREVLEAYDQYVEPMNEMMDSGLSGTFYPYLEAAEQALDHANEQLDVQGTLYSHRLQLRQVAYQAKELRRLGRVVAQQCADTLLPLREAVRQHNDLTTAISTLLGQVRKHGLTRAMRAAHTDSPLPLWRATRPRRISVGDEILGLMAKARHYSPVVQAFPEALATDGQQVAEWVDESALQQRLQADLPVDNLMTWLRHNYPALPDAVVLRLYHELVRNPAWQASLQAQTTTTDLQRLRVHYHPHRLSPA